MRATSGLRRQIPADAAASQLGEPSSPAFPLLPGDGTQPSPGPLVEVAQHRRSLAEVEVAAPPSEVDRQLLDDLREALASRTTRQFPHSASEPGQRLRRDAPSRLCPTREAEAQELALTRSGDRTLRLVDPELEASGQEPFDARHYPLAGSLTAHVDVAVVGIAHEVEAPRLQFLVQHVKHQVRQERRERPPCGVPSSVAPTSPSASTPAVRKPRISVRMRLSATRFATNPIRMS